MRTRLSRVIALLAATAATALTLLVSASPAQAESPILGVLSLSAASGTVTDTPFVASATTNAPCPSGYGDNASLRAGKPGGPYALLGRIGGDGGYDTAASVTLPASRSLTTVLGGTPADGDYEVVVTCSGVLTGVHPKSFSTYITVTGADWRVKAAAATTTTVRGSAHVVKAGRTLTLTAAVTPAGNGPVTFTDGTTALGTVQAAAGTATLATTGLAKGWHQIGASFTPDDPRAQLASSSKCSWWVYVY
ncbi:hypothetical protein Afil01_05180 [Actinorhabdospora filicis]|uniref:Bacterial Ig-like domain-containing protein n=1 Tax=Actinorhabdospora filicis TaxID=1785913 RepID=A0A9W6W7P9_9ACTN|nr:Ig-like domain repeat protein [Actinorhabdospora filicis]GLZ75711.1 hypothetical protein Afil01_05180 [Actinorhabdospora filicis]